MAAASEFFGPVPVVAGYVPYLTRLTVSLQPTVDNGNLRILTVPQGHWYRVIAGSCSFVTSAVAGNRTYSYIVQDSKGASQFEIVAPAAIPASASPRLVCGPLLAGFSNLTSLLAGGEQFPIPDLLWPGGYQLLHFVNGSQAGDQYSSNPAPAFLIEDYIEAASAPGDVAPAPPPLQL